MIGETIAEIAAIKATITVVSVFFITSTTFLYNIQPDVPCLAKRLTLLLYCISMKKAIKTERRIYMTNTENKNIDPVEFFDAVSENRQT